MSGENLQLLPFLDCLQLNKPNLAHKALIKCILKLITSVYLEKLSVYLIISWHSHRMLHSDFVRLLLCLPIKREYCGEIKECIKHSKDG